MPFPVGTPGSDGQLLLQFVYLLHDGKCRLNGLSAGPLVFRPSTACAVVHAASAAQASAAQTPDTVAARVMEVGVPPVWKKSLQTGSSWQPQVQG